MFRAYRSQDSWEVTPKNAHFVGLACALVYESILCGNWVVESYDLQFHCHRIQPACNRAYTLSFQIILKVRS